MTLVRTTKEKKLKQGGKKTNYRQARTLEQILNILDSEIRQTEKSDKGFGSKVCERGQCTLGQEALGGGTWLPARSCEHR